LRWHGGVAQKTKHLRSYITHLKLTIRHLCWRQS
jgi:hypothetical protein